MLKLFTITNDVKVYFFGIFEVQKIYFINNLNSSDMIIMACMFGLQQEFYNRYPFLFYKIYNGFRIYRIKNHQNTRKYVNLKNLLFLKEKNVVIRIYANNKNFGFFPSKTLLSESFFGVKNSFFIICKKKRQILLDHHFVLKYSFFIRKNIKFCLLRYIGYSNFGNRRFMYNKVFQRREICESFKKREFIFFAHQKSNHYECQNILRLNDRFKKMIKSKEKCHKMRIFIFLTLFGKMVINNKNECLKFDVMPLCYEKKSVLRKILFANCEYLNYAVNLIQMNDVINLKRYVTYITNSSESKFSKIFFFSNKKSIFNKFICLNGKQSVFLEFAIFKRVRFVKFCYKRICFQRRNYLINRIFKKNISRNTSKLVILVYKKSLIIKPNLKTVPLLILLLNFSSRKKQNFVIKLEDIQFSFLEELNKSKLLIHTKILELNVIDEININQSKLKYMYLRELNNLKKACTQANWFFGKFVIIRSRKAILFFLRFYWYHNFIKKSINYKTENLAINIYKKVDFRVMRPKEVFLINSYVLENIQVKEKIRFSSFLRFKLNINVILKGYINKNTIFGNTTYEFINEYKDLFFFNQIEKNRKLYFLVYDDLIFYIENEKVKNGKNGNNTRLYSFIFAKNSFLHFLRNINNFITINEAKRRQKKLKILNSVIMFVLYRTYKYFINIRKISSISNFYEHLTCKLRYREYKFQKKCMFLDLIICKTIRKIYWLCAYKNNRKNKKNGKSNANDAEKLIKFVENTGFLYKKNINICVNLHIFHIIFFVISVQSKDKELIERTFYINVKISLNKKIKIIYIFYQYKICYSNVSNTTNASLYKYLIKYGVCKIKKGAKTNRNRSLFKITNCYSGNTNKVETNSITATQLMYIFISINEFINIILSDKNGKTNKNNLCTENYDKKNYFAADLTAIFNVIDFFTFLIILSVYFKEIKIIYIEIFNINEKFMNSVNRYNIALEITSLILLFEIYHRETVNIPAINKLSEHFIIIEVDCTKLLDLKYENLFTGFCLKHQEYYLFYHCVFKKNLIVYSIADVFVINVIVKLEKLLKSSMCRYIYISKYINFFVFDKGFINIRCKYYQNSALENRKNYFKIHYAVRNNCVNINVLDKHFSLVLIKFIGIYCNTFLNIKRKLRKFKEYENKIKSHKNALIGLDDKKEVGIIEKNIRLYSIVKSRILQMCFILLEKNICMKKLENLFDFIFFNFLKKNHSRYEISKKKKLNEYFSIVIDCIILNLFSLLTAVIHVSEGMVFKNGRKLFFNFSNIICLLASLDRNSKVKVNLLQKVKKDTSSENFLNKKLYKFNLNIKKQNLLFKKNMTNVKSDAKKKKINKYKIEKTKKTSSKTEKKNDFRQKIDLFMKALERPNFKSCSKYFEKNTSSMKFNIRQNSLICFNDTFMTKSSLTSQKLSIYKCDDLINQKLLSSDFESNLENCINIQENKEFDKYTQNNFISSNETNNKMNYNMFINSNFCENSNIIIRTTNKYEDELIISNNKINEFSNFEALESQNDKKNTKIMKGNISAHRGLNSKKDIEIINFMSDSNPGDQEYNKNNKTFGEKYEEEHSNYIKKNSNNSNQYSDSCEGTLNYCNNEKISNMDKNKNFKKVNTEKEILITDIKNFNVYINTQEEAILIAHAFRLNLFHLSTERLDQKNREKIRNGDVFCFIENEQLRRWTDGKIWSPSKIVGYFLQYKEVPRHLSKNAIKKKKSYCENYNYSKDIKNRKSNLFYDYKINRNITNKNPAQLIRSKDNVFAKNQNQKIFFDEENDVDENFGKTKLKNFYDRKYQNYDLDIIDEKNNNFRRNTDIFSGSKFIENVVDDEKNKFSTYIDRSSGRKSNTDDVEDYFEKDPKSGIYTLEDINSECIDRDGKKYRNNATPEPIGFLEKFNQNNNYRSPFKKLQNNGNYAKFVDNNNGKFTLYKKTISLTLNNKVYHLIAYFKPFYYKPELLEILFFAKFHAFLEQFAELKTDKGLKNALLESRKYRKQIGSKQFKSTSSSNNEQKENNFVDEIEKNLENNNFCSKKNSNSLELAEYENDSVVLKKINTQTNTNEQVNYLKNKTKDEEEEERGDKESRKIDNLESETKSSENTSQNNAKTENQHENDEKIDFNEFTPQDWNAFYELYNVPLPTTHNTLRHERSQMEKDALDCLIHSFFLRKF
ncbi:hypothetical protein EDEG_03638 [Edhazardia aedis USNM 41457]|uniref:Uncharacterized protein n=1 Tax=Edhazardia aedis (strain USNM 41457) TaxID=1003232 RepID=J9D2S6_EDHAE|nr:hypothetical protein EDEG_03638 [Edhazardia aedis USNM 41457]|eukprot:EJW01884.1 hypothetical protein EDEG_03638 [Edhazardia aedis USNM 41457]